MNLSIIASHLHIITTTLPTTSTAPDATLTTRDLCFAAFIGGVAVFGLLSNGGAMFILYKGGKIKQAFQQLCFSHCVSNFTNMLFFMFYCVPIILLKTDFSYTNAFGKLIGGFMVALWDVSVYSHLMASINRLIVITWPVKSREFLTQRNSTIMISIVWFLGFVHFIPYFYVSECYIVFYPQNYLWAFSPNYCGWLLGKVLDFSTGVSVFVLILIMDMWTLFRIGRLRATVHAQNSRSRRQDIKFFIQTTVQFFLFVLKLTTFYFISGFFLGDLVGNHTEVFLTTSFVWQFCHCLDGAVLIPFHISDYLKRRKGMEITTYGGQSLNPISGKFDTIEK